MERTKDCVQVLLSGDGQPTNSHEQTQPLGVKLFTEVDQRLQDKFGPERVC
jgi:hypothetical protein